MPGCSGCWPAHRPVSRAPRAEQWLAAAHAALELYGDHSAIAFQALAAEVHSEVRLLRATQAELAAHARSGRPATGGRPGRAGPQPARPGQIGGPALVATMDTASRFATAAKFRSFTGLAPRASETGQTDRKGQPSARPATGCCGPPWSAPPTTPAAKTPSSPASTGPRWSSAAKTTSGRSVVAAHLAERAWTVMDRGTPYVICDTDATPVTPAQAKQIIAERWTVPEEVRRRRRSREGSTSPARTCARAQGATRRPSPSSATLANHPAASSRPSLNLDSQASIGNQTTAAMVGELGPPGRPVVGDVVAPQVGLVADALLAEQAVEGTLVDSSAPVVSSH